MTCTCKAGEWLCAAFLCLAGVWPASADVVLSEIMFDPAGSDSYDEYVELYNTASTGAVDLAGWTLGDGVAFDRIVAEDRGTRLEAGGFALILDSGYFEYSTSYDPLPAEVLVLTIDGASFGDRGWNNQIPEPVVLLDAEGDTVACHWYTVGNAPGHSDEKILLEGGDGPGNWGDSVVEGGTPGLPNSVCPPAYDVSLGPDAIRFVPREPAPSQTLRILLTVANTGTQPIEDIRIVLYRDMTDDTVLTPGTDEPMDTLFVEHIGTGESFEVESEWPHVPSGTHTLWAEAILARDGRAANNIACATLRVPFPATVVVINEIMFAPVQGASEWVELFDNAESPLDLRGWRLCGRLLSAQTLTLDSGGYLVVAADSASCVADFRDIDALVVSPEGGWSPLNNEGEAVVLQDQTGAVIDSVFYERNWSRVDGASLERIHPSLDGNEAPSWSSCVLETRGTPGAANSVLAHDLPAAAVLDIAPNPFDDQTVISYRLPETTATVSLWIYDRHGRRVRRLLDAAPSGSTRTKVWDGRDDGGARLGMGIYVVYLEAIDPAGGTLHRLKRPVVLARRL